MNVSEPIFEEFIIPCDLIKLYSVLEKMEAQSRISDLEMEDILNAAGLKRINEDTWQDEKGAKYRL